VVWFEGVVCARGAAHLPLPPESNQNALALSRRYLSVLCRGLLVPFSLDCDIFFTCSSRQLQASSHP